VILQTERDGPGGNTVLLKNDFYKYLKCFILILAFTIIASLAGCGKSEGSPEAKQQSEQASENYEKAPEELKKIEETIESIFSLLEGPAVNPGNEKEKDEHTSGMSEIQQTMKKEGTQQGGQQQGTQQQGTQQQGTQQQETQQQGTKQQEAQQQGTQQQGTQEKAQQQAPETDKAGGAKKQEQGAGAAPEGGDAKQETLWNEINSLVKELHYQWNSFMPEIMKKGADIKLIDEFGTELNNLTDTIMTKNKIKTMLSANTLYSKLAEIFSLYRTKMPSEIKRLRYYIRNVILNSESGVWDDMENNLSEIRASWSLLENALGEEQKQDANKLELSLYELEKVVTAKNAALINLKGRIALSNIESLEKSFSKS